MIRRVYLDIKWETFARPLVLPLLNQLLSCLCVSHGHHNMCTSFRKLPANKEAKASAIIPSLHKIKLAIWLTGKEDKPSGLTANAVGGASDNASEAVDGRERERVVQMRGGDPLEENLSEDAAPSSHPLHPSQTLLLLRGSTTLLYTVSKDKKCIFRLN